MLLFLTQRFNLKISNESLILYKTQIMQKLFFFILSILVFPSFKNDKPAYVLYNSKGQKITFSKMIKDLKTKEVILFGEIHNNPIAHWLQIEVTKELGESNNLILGAEMFEADNQAGLNLYLKDSITSNQFDTIVRLWPNYKTDYKPLVDYAKSNNFPFIATNIPRRYAAMVHKNGGFNALDSLSSEEKSWIVPYPFPFDPEIPSYKAILNMFGGHGTPDIIKAQAIKDATMAHFILKSAKKNHTFLHYNGAYHSNNYEGILWYINQEKVKTICSTISTVNQKNVHKLDSANTGIADYIIAVDNDMTSTY